MIVMGNPLPIVGSRSHEGEHHCMTNSEQNHEVQHPECIRLLGAQRSLPWQTILFRMVYSIRCTEYHPILLRSVHLAPGSFLCD